MTRQKVSPHFVVDRSSARPDRDRGQRCSAATSLATTSTGTVLLPCRVSQIAGHAWKRRLSSTTLKLCWTFHRTANPTLHHSQLTQIHSPSSKLLQLKSTKSCPPSRQTKPLGLTTFQLARSQILRSGNLDKSDMSTQPQL